MKRGIAGVALAAALAIAAAATRPFWVAPDAAQAQAWLRDAADQRASASAGASADAAREDARIARLLAQGSAGHVPAAARLLALRALDPARGTPDPARAAGLMGRAADGGDVPAMFLYANMLRAGAGVKRDDAKALALYQAAGDADYAPAIQALALAWRYGELGLQADSSQSRLMDHEAAEALAHAGN